MKTVFKYRRLDYSDSLSKYAEAKLDEIGRFLLKDGQSSVSFWKENHNYCVEVSINTRQKYFKASAEASDIYVAVDLVCDKLERQFLKIKEVYTDHKKAA